MEVLNESRKVFIISVSNTVSQHILQIYLQKNINMTSNYLCNSSCQTFEYLLLWEVEIRYPHCHGDKPRELSGYRFGPQLRGQPPFPKVPTRKIHEKKVVSRVIFVLTQSFLNVSVTLCHNLILRFRQVQNLTRSHKNQTESAKT